jgi:hypothetical protein
MQRRRIGFSLGTPQLYAEATEDDGKGSRRRPPFCRGSPENIRGCNDLDSRATHPPTAS